MNPDKLLSLQDAEMEIAKNNWRPENRSENRNQNCDFLRN